MTSQFDRRDFLKVMGLSGTAAALVGCDMPTTVTLEEGEETVVSYLSPDEIAIPGIGVYYASTCGQCAVGCGIHGRVREGRALKIEGNPDSGSSRGKLCQMGQAAVQAHYHPDRLTAPMARKNGQLTEVTWEEALSTIEAKAGPGAVEGGRVGWMTRSVSGHQRVLVDAHLAALGSDKHYVAEVVNNAVWRAACRDALGTETPRLDIANAAVILSFGADFLGTWGAPVANMADYAQFRSAPRGMLIQAEGAMSLTGANADLWVACRPGGEGALALGIANAIVRKHQDRRLNLSPAERALVSGFDMEMASEICGVAADKMVKIAGILMDRSPSLVLAGGSAEGQAHGYKAVMAALLLNKMLGNIGRTVAADGALPFPDLEAKAGGTRAYRDLAADIDAGALDVLFIAGANPAFEAPAGLNLADKIADVGFKVAFATHPDETTAMADLVLPLHSALEDWGTHVAPFQTGVKQVHLQQPLMEPLHSGTRGLGDLLLALMKLHDPGTYDGFDDYYGFLRNFAANLPPHIKNPTMTDDAFWNGALQRGAIDIGHGYGTIADDVKAAAVPKTTADGDYPMHLVPAPRQGLWDGRHANLPWLQEAPDQISKVVWDSWCELHPSTAEALGVKTGDFVRISSAAGTIETAVYVYRGVHPDAVAVPMGRGHSDFGRYASGNGVNPLALIGAEADETTGEMALYGTRVKIAPVGTSKRFAQLNDSVEEQHGRRLVGTVTATRFKRTEGGA